MNKTHKVVDYFNGWESESMTFERADRYFTDHLTPTRGIELASAEWLWDYRFGEYAWFDGDKRIS